jgi:hypothetical protein
LVNWDIPYRREFLVRLMIFLVYFGMLYNLKVHCKDFEGFRELRKGKDRQFAVIFRGIVNERLIFALRIMRGA